MVKITLDGIDLEIQANGEKPSHFTGVLWGPAKAGKTTMYATLPKPILWIMNDLEGEVSVPKGDDHLILPLYKAKTSVVDQLIVSNSIFYSRLKEQVVEAGVKSLVFDSLTAFASLAFNRAIEITKANSREPSKVTVFMPGLQGWGARSMATKQLMVSLTYFAASCNLHLGMTAHEAAEKTKTVEVAGQSTSIPYLQTMSLGGDLPNDLSRQISEVWYIKDENGQRKVYLRPFGVKQPMGTRMFDTRTKSSFVWAYDSFTKKGEGGLSTWIKAWEDNKYQPLDLNITSQT